MDNTLQILNGSQREQIRALAAQGLKAGEILNHIDFPGLAEADLASWMAAGCPEPASQPETPKRSRRPSEPFAKSLRVAAGQVCGLLEQLDDADVAAKIAEDPALYVQLLQALARLSEADTRAARLRFSREQGAKDSSKGQGEAGLRAPGEKCLQMELNLL